MDKMKKVILKEDRISEEIYENIFEIYFDTEEEKKPGGELNETEPE
ncbi:MAG: hypothetical protein ACQESN_05890 [Thermotogota bacterium]